MIDSEEMARIDLSRSGSDKKVLWPLPVILCTFLLLSVLGGGVFWSESAVQFWLARQAMSFIPSADCIAHSSPLPAQFGFVYGIQWLAAIPYLYYWFVVVPPWSESIRAAARVKAASLSAKHRVVFFFGVLMLVAYVLGDFGVIGFPTFFNGHIVCAGERSPAILSSVHDHWFAAAVYGAFAVFCECTLLWMLAFFVANFRVYMAGDSLAD